jgi:DNA-binding response OmpR family regulator
MRILLVEDDSRIARFVSQALREQAYAVDATADGDDALFKASINDYDAVILDLMIPGRDGFEVCRELRATGSSVPVIMLTARDAVHDRVAGLDSGADDYLTKPFEMEELLARINALLRRVEGEEVFRVGDLEVHTASREVWRGEREIQLTHREYELLEFMAKHPRRVLSRDLLLSRVWDQEFGIPTNVVDVYVGYLRKKVDADGEPKLIQTVRGAGYALKEK